MEYPKKVTVIQAIAILVGTIIGVGVLPLPLFAVRAADTGAPLVTLLGIVIAFFGLSLITILGMKYPHKSIIQYSENILGKWLGRLGSIIIILFFALLTSLTSREFGTVVITAILPKTPLEITVIVMLLLAALAARNDMVTFAYIQHFYFPLILAPALIIVALSLQNANFIFLQPIWGNEPSGMFIGALTVAAIFQGTFIYTLVIPLMRRPERAMSSSIWAMIIAGGLYLLIVVATVAVFGPEEIKQLLWPTLELARTTSLPGNILERLDIIFLVVWVIAVFTTLLSSYTLTIHALSQLFRLRDHKMFSLFMLPFVFLLAMIPQNVLHLYEVIELVGRIGLLITIGYPALLLMVHILRKKKGEKHADRRSTYSR